MARFHVFTRKLVIVLLVVCLLTQPVGAAAAPLPIQNALSLVTLTTPGLEYLDSFLETLKSAGDLIPRLGALTSGSPTQPSIGELTVARDDLFTLVMQSAQSIGHIEALLEALSSVTNLIGPAADVEQIGSTGIPVEIREGLINKLGFTSEQVSQIDQAFQDEIQDRNAIHTQGLPQELENFLFEAGYSTDEIQDIETSVASHGVTQAGLSTRAEQLLASRDDLATLRAGAHILYVQLIGTEIAVRQTAGESSRTLTDEELEEIAKDELRLLIHAAHIQSLLDQGQSDAGEGDYWFIERYAGRAAERLESLLIETQNYGLAVELFIMMELHSIASEARFGGMQFAGQEVAHYAGLLAEIISAQSFFAQHHKDAITLFASLSKNPVVQKYFTWPLAEKDVLRVAKLARLRFENNSNQLVLDDFPGNNSLDVLLAAGYSEIPYVANIWHLLVLPLSRQAIDLLSLLLGFRDPRNTEEMMAVMVVSLIPLLDILNDLITYATNPSTFVKVIALVGIFLSLGEITTLLFPGALALGPPAVVADTMSTGVRTVYTGYGDTAAKAILDRLDDPEAIQWVTDLMRSGGRRILDEGENLAQEGVPAVIRALVDSNLFDDYLSYARLADKLGLLEEGADEGAILIGRILRQNVDLDLIDIDFHRQLKEWGEELIAQGIDLSEDAAGGIGRAINEVGSEGVERLKCGLQYDSGEYIGEEVEFALDLVRQAGFEWTNEGLEGVGLSTRFIGAEGTQRLFDLGSESREAFTAIAIRGKRVWDADTGEGLARFFEKQLSEKFLEGITQSDYYLDVLRVYDDDTCLEVLGMFSRGNPSSDEHILNRITDPREAFEWVKNGTGLELLEDGILENLNVRISVPRSVMNQSEYQEILQFIEENLDIDMNNKNQVAEAFAMVAGVRELQRHGNYDKVLIRVKQNGIDGLAFNLDTNRWVQLEGKGTYTGADLRGSFFPETQYGWENTTEWILNKADRHFSGVPEDRVADVQAFIDSVEAGEPYELVILRGGTTEGETQSLDFGTGLRDYIKRVTPEGDQGKNFSITFLFVNVLGY